MSHSPLPWSYSKAYQSIQIWSDNGMNLVASGLTVDNAEFILDATQAYYPMIKALKEARDFIRSQNKGKCLESVLDTLALVEGPETKKGKAKK